MLQSETRSLRGALRTSSGSGFLSGAEEPALAWSALQTGSVLGEYSGRLDGACVLIAVTSQFTAAAALLELDGIARRVVLYPPDLSLEHIDFVAGCAGTDTIVSDRLPDGREASTCFAPSKWTSRPGHTSAEARLETEWVLLTSGTTGRPKLVVHTLASLTGAIETSRPPADEVVWCTFYDIRRYGGLQIFLRAAMTGTSMVLSSAPEATVDFLKRAAACGVTHISGTPSHWRRALMSPAANVIVPAYVRLSGEIADQGILNQLRSTYPQAKIAHAFATTEAGVAFAVDDGLSGFPVSMLEGTAGVEMKIESGSLRIRSNRTARCYLGGHVRPLRDAEGFVDTGDVVEQKRDRCHFIGRGDGMINVGGMKVFPEEVEAVINGHPGVEMSLVRTRKNPITGALVVADVVLKNAPETASGDIRIDILRLCRETLSPYKVPAAIYFVPTLAVAESGKLIRPHA